MISACGDSDDPPSDGASAITSTSVADSSSTTFEPPFPVPVETDQVKFEMPAPPTAETGTDDAFGIQTTTTSWTSEVGDLLVGVAVADLGRDLLTRDGAAVGSLASVIAGVVERTGGTVETEEAFIVDGQEGRRAVVRVDGETILLDAMVNKEAGLLVLFTTGGGATVEAAHRRLVDSFEWRV